MLGNPQHAPRWREPTDRRRTDALWWLACAAVAFVSIALRVPRLGESIWHDELYRTRVFYDTAGAMRHVWHDVHNPLYNLAMMGWTSLFGDGEVAIRLPSFVCTLLVAGCFGAAAAKLWGRWVGLWVCAWAGVCPPLVWHATVAKNNAMTIACCALLVASAMVLLADGRRAQRLGFAGLLAGTLVGLWTDMQTWLAVVPVLAWSVLLPVFGVPRTVARRVQGAVGLGVLGALPLMIYKAMHVEYMFRSYLLPFDAWELVYLFARWLPLGSAHVPVHWYDEGWRRFVAADVAALALGAILSAGAFLRSERAARDRSAALLLLLAVGLPVLFMWVQSAWAGQGDRTDRFMYQPRNLLLVAAPFGTLLVLGAVRVAGAVHQRVYRVAITGALLAVVLGGPIWGSVAMQTVAADRWTVYKPRPDWRAAGAQLVSWRDSTAQGVLPAIGCDPAPLAYYVEGVPYVVTGSASMTLDAVGRVLAPVDPDWRRNPFAIVSNEFWTPTDALGLGATVEVVDRASVFGVELWLVRATPP